jgi:hypothetical protein
MGSPATRAAGSCIATTQSAATAAVMQAQSRMCGACQPLASRAPPSPDEQIEVFGVGAHRDIGLEMPYGQRIGQFVVDLQMVEMFAMASRSKTKVCMVFPASLSA